MLVRVCVYGQGACACVQCQ